MGMHKIWGEVGGNASQRVAHPQASHQRRCTCGQPVYLLVRGAGGELRRITPSKMDVVARSLDGLDPSCDVR
jgi:hypothetical protein